MSHLLARDVRALLHNKFVVVMGDSVQRAVYKDLVLLLQKDRLLSSRQLKTKGEMSFERDVLLEGGQRGRMHNGTHYREVRQFSSGHHLVRFYFLTRAYSHYVEDILVQLRWGEHAPDLLIMNSCLWDLSRYGRNFRRSYREGLERLFRRLDQVLPKSCLVVWNTTMPVARVVTGGFLPPGGPPDPSHLREDVMEANFYSAVEAVGRGFDVLDLHFHFRHAGRHRLHDGVHWDGRAHRHLSQLLLAHVADAWGVTLPRRRPVGRWLREEGSPDAAERRPAAAEGRQPRERPRGRREPAPPRPPPSPRFPHRSPRPSSSRARTPHPPYRRDVRAPSAPPMWRGPVYSEFPTRPVEYPREANWMDQEPGPGPGRGPGPGPIRRHSSQHRDWASPPYPPRRPSEPRRFPGRRSQQQT